MQTVGESENPAGKKQGLSLFESIRTFAAAVGTTAVLMLTLCGVLDLYLTPDSGPEAVRAASVFGSAETAPAAVSRTVRLGGDVFGIRMFSDGVIVASLSDIYTENGTICPAKEAGIAAGDYILTANGQSVATNAELAAVLQQGGTVELTLRRGDETCTATLTPALCGSSYRAGMWIRDSAAGIGTVTFYSGDGRSFAALGHGICDADTKEVLEMRSGEPAPIAICGIAKGREGEPGRLRGYFLGDTALGTLVMNEETGIYGTMAEPMESETVEVMERGEVHEGPAQIAATIDENGVRLFDAEIERVRESAGETKTLVVRVTDPELLQKTGGIVQGMSGCPVLQDGKLAGAVTHVFVDDPTRGYGIFADTMLHRSVSISG